MECQICFETSPCEKFEFLPCSHNLCKDCLDKISNSCPFCRQPFREEDEDSDGDDDYWSDDEDENLWFEPPTSVRSARIDEYVLPDLIRITIGSSLPLIPFPPLPAQLETLNCGTPVPAPLEFVSSTSLINEVEEPCPKTESNIKVSRRLYFFKYLNMKKVNIINLKSTSPLIRIH